MGESPDKHAGGDNKAESAAGENRLPVVWSPKLEAGDGTTDKSPEADAGAPPPSDKGEPIGGKSHEAAAGAAPVQPLRFALLAASIGLAAALGSFVGSLSASGFAHFWPAPASKTELGDLAALKANLEGAFRNASSQLTKIADRLDHVERAQIDPAAKIAHIADTLDRLDKRSAAAPDMTGTIAPSPPSAAEAKLPERILRGWVVEDVRGGRALVLSRYGGLFDVATGSMLPGLGRVEAIKREDGEWVVVTARGVITSGR
jgi:hypothetical protein